MMRALCTKVARSLPSAASTNRVLPWVTLGLAIFAAIWSAFVYSTGLDIQRQNAALRFHGQLLASFPRGIEEITNRTGTHLVQRALQTRCTVYAESVAEGTLSADLDLPENCDDISIKNYTQFSGMAAVTSDAINATVSARFDDAFGINDGGARRMMALFRSLQICVEQDLCDAAVTAGLFREDIMSFLNLSCRLMAEDGFRYDGLQLVGFVHRSLSARRWWWGASAWHPQHLTCARLMQAYNGQG